MDPNMAFHAAIAREVVREWQERTADHGPTTRTTRWPAWILASVFAIAVFLTVDSFHRVAQSQAEQARIEQALRQEADEKLRQTAPSVALR